MPEAGATLPPAPHLTRPKALNSQWARTHRSAVWPMSWRSGYSGSGGDEDKARARQAASRCHAAWAREEVAVEMRKLQGPSRQQAAGRGPV